MTREKKVAEYPEVFKLQVVRDYYANGVSKTDISRKWGVSRAALLNWVNQWPIDSKSLSLPLEMIESYRMEHRDTQLSNEEILQQRISDLEKALALEKMRSRAFEKMIEIAEAEEGISILKKDGAKP